MIRRPSVTFCDVPDAPTTLADWTAIGAFAIQTRSTYIAAMAAAELHHVVKQSRQQGTILIDDGYNAAPVYWMCYALFCQRTK
jgi:hypothetical protein